MKFSNAPKIRALTFLGSDHRTRDEASTRKKYSSKY